MRKKAVVSWLAALVLILLASGCSENAAPDPPFVTSGPPAAPNVIFVIIDTLRADHLGAYGSDLGLTPNLDAFASESYAFENAVATSSWTRPSIASMLTSRYPTALGVLDRQDTLDPTFATFPVLLRQFGGYTTLGLIGNGNVSQNFGFGAGFDVYRMSRLRRAYPGDFAIPVAEGITREALELVDSRDTRKPFLLLVLYVDPHDPYLPHSDLMGRDPGGRFSGSRQHLQQLARARPAGPEDFDRIRFLYAGEVKYVDRWVGELLRALRQRDLYEDAMVVITADHGEGLWSHGRRGHGDDLYQEQVHVPLMIKYPGMAPDDARRIDAPVSLVDLAPTILRTVGAPVPPSFQGSDLTPLVRGERRGDAFDYVYSELDLEGRAFESIRKGSLKLIVERQKEAHESTTSRELYDLASDPEERHDLLADDSQVTALDAALERWNLALLATAHRNEAHADLDAETVRSLRALGYLTGDSDRASGSRTPPRANTRAQELDLPADPTASAIRFGEVQEGVHQVLHGLDPAASNAEGVPLAGQAAVYLARRPGYERWEVRLLVAEGEDRRPRAFDVSVNFRDPVRTILTETGEYRIEGALPEGGREDAVRLDLRCFIEERESIMSTGEGEDCLTVLAISAS